VSYRVGDACKAPQKSTHLRARILTLQLQGTIALNIGHRGALKVQIRPLGVETGRARKNGRRSRVVATAKVMEAPEGVGISPSWAQFYMHVSGRRRRP
jgi:hypothetical protein